MTNSLLETLLADPHLLAELEKPQGEHLTITVDLGVFPGTANAEGKPLPQETIESGWGPLSDCQRWHLPERSIVLRGQSGADGCDYRLFGALGQGGSAIVYQAHQRAVDREVAVKVLRDELTESPAARERFLTEARTVGGLDHPNVIALHELATNHDGKLFYSMKRIDGTTWAEVLRIESLENNLGILMRVCDAIRYAHSRGLLHRDIKPENVMLGRFGEVLLADWGLALSVPVQVDANMRQSIGGTPAYMAPELAAGALDSVSTATDVYLLGAVLFHVLTGLPPHHGENVLDCIRAAAKNKIRPTRVSGALMDVAMRAMATAPSDRYASVEEFQAAILSYQKHQESERMVARAQRYIEQANQGQGYDGFGVALNLLGEAVELWPDNQAAIETLNRTRVEFAQRAISLGDFDLAINLLTQAGQGDSELASRVKKRRTQRQRRIEREARLHLLFTHAPDPVLLTRWPEGDVVETNEVFLEGFGFQLNQVLGKTVPELNLWLEPERRQRFLEELNLHGQIDNFETRFRNSQGGEVHVLISGRVVNLDGESLLVTNLRDITQRKVAETELRRSQNRLREFTRLARLGTWELDLQSDRIQWNDELYALIDRQPKQCEPSLETFLAALVDEDVEPFRQCIERAVKTGQPYEFTVRKKAELGRSRRLLVRGHPITDVSGRVIEIYGTVQEVAALR